MSETTIDGFEITNGMCVWNYDLKISFVENAHKYQNPNETIWYNMVDKDGNRMSSMDAKRMWKYHPSTGVEAK